MKNYICATCGTQFDESETEPPHCPICEDERQFVNPSGQQWTTLQKQKKNHKIVFRKIEPHLYAVGCTPAFAIGQRALLLKTPQGNVLWDCISFIDDATVDIIDALGGLHAIAISHPHFYASMIEWSQAFGAVPIYLHQKDREWVQRPHKNIHFWDGSSQDLFAGLTLYNVGGHFPGATILHWPSGANGKGALLTSDIISVTPGRDQVSFMYSYPNLIPLNAEKIDHIATTLNPLTFDRIYGGWWDDVIGSGAKKAVQISAKRYLKAIK